MHSTWDRLAERRSFSPTTAAVRPPMPASTSSKTSVRPGCSPAPSVLNASMTRDSSPPEAMRASGRGSSPRFGGQEELAAVDPAAVPGRRALRRSSAARRTARRPSPGRRARASSAGPDAGGGVPRAPTAGVRREEPVARGRSADSAASLCAGPRVERGRVRARARRSWRGRRRGWARACASAARSAARRSSTSCRRPGRGVEPFAGSRAGSARGRRAAP